MSIPYRHKRALARIGTLLAVLFLIFVVTWLCWVVWLQRYAGHWIDHCFICFEIPRVSWTTPNTAAELITATAVAVTNILINIDFNVFVFLFGHECCTWLTHDENFKSVLI